jgi:hypothetical protein
MVVQDFNPNYSEGMQKYEILSEKQTKTKRDRAWLKW